MIENITTRNCPDCNVLMNYSNKYSRNNADKRGSVCNNCSQQGENHPWYGKTIPDYFKEKISKKLKGRVITKEAITKWRDTVKKNDSFKHIKGTTRPNPSDETRKKMRNSHIKRLEAMHGNVYPNYNPSSIPIIEAKAKELGITDLQHAENGGEYYIKELGYWVDGYSADKNIVIEYDEPHHKRQVDKDMNRQVEITEHLNCRFIRIVE